MVTLVLRQALKMHLKIAVALCPPTSQRTAQPWPASPLSIIAPMHSVHSILRVRLIIGDDHGDKDIDGDDTRGDNDDDNDDSSENSEYVHDIFLFLTRWKAEIV